MSLWERVFAHVSSVLVIGTGLAYGWMRYFATPADEFSIVNHPLQPLLQHAHIWVAPLLILAVGHLFYRHAWTYWTDGMRPGRRSGLAQVFTAAPMIFSGYFLQTAIHDTWRSIWVAVHIASSLLWIAGYVTHFVRHSTRRVVGF